MTPRSPWSRAVDVGAVCVLMTLALLGLDDSFATRAYLVTGLASLATIVAWTLLCSVQRWSTGVLLLVASLAFPVLGAITALHDYSWLGLPAPHAVGDLLTAVITSPLDFLTTIPPVDPTGSVLALPFEIAYLLGGAAAAFALQTRRPLLPVVPAVLALAACIALGTEKPAYLLARAVAFVAVAVLWVGLRGTRRRAVRRAGRGRPVRALAAVSLVLGSVVLTTLAVPAATSGDRVVLRGRVGSGQDVSRLDNPLSGFRRFTRQPAGTPDNVARQRLLRITGLPSGVPLRIVALDQYDGSTWSAGNDTVPDDNADLFQRIGERVGEREPGRRITVGVEVQSAWTSSWLPLAGQLTGISFDYLDGRAQRDDVRYDVATRTAMVVGGLGAKDDYHFTATVSDTELTRSAAPYGSGRALMASGAFLDRYLAPWRGSGLAPMAQVFSLARYLRVNGRYSDGAARGETGFLPGHSQERLGAQFFGAGRIVGDDEQYAAFMALAANRLGVPARVVVGAHPGARGWVRGDDVLAWVELRVADGTWRVLPARRFMSHKPPRHRFVRQSTSSFVRSTTRPEQSEAVAPQARRPRERHHGGVVEVATRWPARVALGFLLLAGGVPLAKAVRRRRRRLLSPMSRRVAAGWDEVLDLARDTSQRVPEGWPRTEQARRLTLATELAFDIDALVFAPAEPTAEQAHVIWQRVRAERRRVARSSGVVRRVLAWWHPASLWHSLRGLRGRGAPPGPPPPPGAAAGPRARASRRELAGSASSTSRG